MIGKPDFVIDEVVEPPGALCSSGHVAPKSWSKRGPGTPLEPTLFYRVVSIKDSKVNGVYCEPCLMIANAMAREKKKR